MERNERNNDRHDRENDRGDRSDRGDRGDRGDKEGKKSTRSKYRSEYPADFHFDYKDPMTLGRFIMEGGKIVPARISKLSLSQQKRVARAIRKARSLALLPNGTEAYDNFERPEAVSAKPLSLD